MITHSKSKHSSFSNNQRFKQRINYNSSNKKHNPQNDWLQNYHIKPSLLNRRYYSTNQQVVSLGVSYIYFPNDKQKKIGEGASSIVFEGRNSKTNQKVAIKVINKTRKTHSDTLSTLFRNQIKVLKELSKRKTTGILKLLDSYETEKHIYIVTQYCKDSDLERYLRTKTNQKLIESQAFQLFQKLVLGYAEIVKIGVVHRDLKPSNILLDGIHPKIADFGFAYFLKDKQKKQNNLSVGSPLYMSPQCLEGFQATSKSDIFSLGVIFYQILHGRTPWKARTQKQLLKNQKTEDLYIDPHLSTLTKIILKKCLKIQQSERLEYQELKNLIIVNENVFKLQGESQNFMKISNSFFLERKAKQSCDININKQLFRLRKNKNQKFCINQQKRHIEFSDRKNQTKTDNQNVKIKKQPISFLKQLTKMDQLLGLQQKIDEKQQQDQSKLRKVKVDQQKTSDCIKKLQKKNHFIKLKKSGIQKQRKKQRGRNLKKLINKQNVIRRFSIQETLLKKSKKKTMQIVNKILNFLNYNKQINQNTNTSQNQQQIKYDNNSLIYLSYQQKLKARCFLEYYIKNFLKNTKQLKNIQKNNKYSTSRTAANTPNSSINKIQLQNTFQNDQQYSNCMFIDLKNQPVAVQYKQEDQKIKLNEQQAKIIYDFRILKGFFQKLQKKMLLKRNYNKLKQNQKTQCVNINIMTKQQNQFTNNLKYLNQILNQQMI